MGVVGRYTVWYGIGLVMLWVSHHVWAERYWLPTVLCYVPQHAYGIPAVVLLAWALKLKRWSVAVLAAVALLFWAFGLMGVALPLSSGKATARIMTYNIYGVGIAPLSEKINDILAQDPDVFVLQEARPNVAAELAKLIPRWYWEEAGDVVVFSKKPLLNKQVWDSAWRHRKILEVDTVLDGKLVKIIGIHLPAVSTYDRRSKRPDFTSITQDTPRRTQDINLLLDRAQQSTVPVVVAGDFNTPPRSPAYFKITHKLQDSFAMAGRGLGLSYPVKFPLLRIDYVFVKGLKPVRAYLPPLNVSDHLPLVVDVYLQ